MNIEQALAKLIEHAKAELHLREHRDQEKANNQDHGHDYHQMLQEADRVDRYAAIVRTQHDDSLPGGWRRESA
ncbi:hypothetical protein OIE66_28490 [Nonomuraea sp. NBC_01738]|uniref:hypothetical protein n=1 Tax=Nonomuraea sp. NBC_01738 TaxID=2976003 RepID=UPI002E15EE5A|nr:hypothetical protein OIE66_28490 [Nonomuraea sp. NBC_01738]